jgi:Shedu protein SduA, N-terminal
MAQPKQTKKTILKQAICDVITLREGPQVRLSFVPTLVDDLTQPKAKVEGYFTYERKLATSQGWPIRTPLSSLKAGEAIKLQLTHTELITLLEHLVPLYKFYEGKNQGSSPLPAGTQGIVAHRVDSKEELLHEQHDEELFSALSNWLETSYTYWTGNTTNDIESFWQDAFRTRSHVLSQLFAYPIVVFGEKTYVGGKQIFGTGGKYPDFLLNAASTAALLILEIKTHRLDSWIRNTDTARFLYRANYRGRSLRGCAIVRCSCDISIPL